MTPYLAIAGQIKDAQLGLLAMSDFIQDYSGGKFFQLLVEHDTEVEVQGSRLLLSPGRDPKKLALALSQTYDIFFSRRMSSTGAYSWEAALGGILLVFPDIEVVDLSGTPPDLNS